MSKQMTYREIVNQIESTANRILEDFTFEVDDQITWDAIVDRIRADIHEMKVQGTIQKYRVTGYRYPDSFVSVFAFTDKGEAIDLRLGVPDQTKFIRAALAKCEKHIATHLTKPLEGWVSEFIKTHKNTLKDSRTWEKFKHDATQYLLPYQNDGTIRAFEVFITPELYTVEVAIPLPDTMRLWSIEINYKKLTESKGGDDE